MLADQMTRLFPTDSILDRRSGNPLLDERQGRSLLDGIDQAPPRVPQCKAKVTMEGLDGRTTSQQITADHPAPLLVWLVWMGRPDWLRGLKS